MIEAMKQMANYIDALGGDSKKYRQAIEQAEKQKSVDYSMGYQNGRCNGIDEGITQPQREWVGLTDEETIDIGTQCQWYDGDCERFDSIGFARAIEAAHGMGGKK